MGVVVGRSKVRNFSKCESRRCGSVATDLYGTFFIKLERCRNYEFTFGLSLNFFQKPTLFINEFTERHQIDKQFQN